MSMHDRDETNIGNQSSINQIFFEKTKKGRKKTLPLIQSASEVYSILLLLCILILLVFESLILKLPTKNLSIIFLKNNRNIYWNCM